MSDNTPPSAPPAVDAADRSSVALRLNALLANREPRLTVATAESCTGGAIAAQITSISGSSTYFLGGVVSYSNDVKTNILGVSREILDSVGAVSQECAQAMVDGVRRLIGADFAVATTGIAGPGGGTSRKPVGLVYIAYAGPDGTKITEHHFQGDRAAVINQATDTALARLLDSIQTALAATNDER